MSLHWFTMMQCFCCPLKSSVHFPNFTTFTITMITILLIFQYYKTCKPTRLIKLFWRSSKCQTICQKNETMAYGLGGEQEQSIITLMNEEYVPIPLVLKCFHWTIYWNISDLCFDPWIQQGWSHLMSHLGDQLWISKQMYAKHLWLHHQIDRVNKFCLRITEPA